MGSPVSPIGRVSFPDAYKARKMEGSAGDPKFAVTLLFDDTAQKSPEFAAMKAAAAAAAKNKWGDKIPKGIRSPFRDGNEKDYDGYAGNVFVRFSSSERPGVVDGRKQEITEDSGRFYAGCFGRVSYTCYAYDNSGNKGVAFGLVNIQKTGDGEPFSSRTDADDDFGAIDDTSGDELAEADSMFS